MNGKILEEVYDRNAPYSDRVRIPFLFQGQYYDHETELAYNRFRYYSPELGRYIRQAKKQYSNAFAEEYRDLGYTSTRKAIRCRSERSENSQEQRRRASSK